MSVFYTFILTVLETDSTASLDIVPAVSYGSREHAERVAAALRTYVLAKYGASGKPELSYRSRIGIAETTDGDPRLGEQIVGDEEVAEIVAHYDTRTLFPEEN